MSDETILWLRDTASANNISTSSIDYVKIEEARRREYEKIEQVNRMYMAARALGFPDRISSQVKYDHPYYVIVSVHRCFDLKYYEWVSTSTQGVNSSCFFQRLRFEPSDGISVYEQISNRKDLEENDSDIPNFVLWLLICMKLFYEKDWDGRQWIDQKDAYNKYGDTNYSKLADISDIQSEIVKQLAEKMARDIDDEIMKEITKSTDGNWKVQNGNAIYHPKNNIIIGGV
jgi:hypothetical protein